MHRVCLALACVCLSAARCDDDSSKHQAPREEQTIVLDEAAFEAYVVRRSACGAQGTDFSDVYETAIKDLRPSAYADFAKQQARVDCVVAAQDCAAVVACEGGTMGGDEAPVLDWMAHFGCDGEVVTRYEASPVTHQGYTLPVIVCGETENPHCVHQSEEEGGGYSSMTGCFGESCTPQSNPDTVSPTSEIAGGFYGSDSHCDGDVYEQCTAAFGLKSRVDCAEYGAWCAKKKNADGSRIAQCVDDTPCAEGVRSYCASNVVHYCMGGVTSDRQLDCSLQFKQSVCMQRKEAVDLETWAEYQNRSLEEMDEEFFEEHVCGSAAGEIAVAETCVGDKVQMCLGAECLEFDCSRFMGAACQPNPYANPNQVGCVSQGW